MKKIIIICFLVSVLLISGCSELDSDLNDISNTKTQTERTESISISQQEDTTQQETIYSINEKVKVDDLTYTITKAETFTEMGISMFKKETNGKFIKVYLKIMNNAKETQQIFTPRFKLQDDQDRKFDRLSDDMIYISDYLEFGKQLQPGLETSGAIVFETPKDSSDLLLIISGDWISTSEIKVRLSNIKDIGKDTTQKEEQDEMWDDAMAESQAEFDNLMNNL